MYKAKVCKIKVVPHPNADRLQIGYVYGLSVIVGMDVKDGDIGVFFASDGQLSNEFLSLHNLYRHSNLNLDTTKQGYFDDNGRVTVEKIRGVKSEGFYCSLSDFVYTGYDLSKLLVGDEFDELNGHKICEKYYTSATRKAMVKTGKRAKMIQVTYNLPRHFDTEQLQYNLDKVESGDLVIITEKLHGTSARFGYVPVTRQNKLKWYQRLLNVLFDNVFPLETTKYEFVIGTRNTIVNQDVALASSEAYRVETARQLNGLLKKGEVVYAEIVGYDSSGKLIMNQQGTGKLPEIKKQYGDVMQYRYGCRWNEISKPQNKLYVYRITQVNEDGFEFELSWNQVKRRASELGLEYVPELTVYYNELCDRQGLSMATYSVDLQTKVLNICEKLVQCNSTLDDSHIREGVCVRLEKADGTMKVYKHKSFEFRVLEGILKMDDSYVDTEEVS